MKKTITAALLLTGIISVIAIREEQASLEEIGGQICLTDEDLIYQDNLPAEAYAILYPVDNPGVMRDKNGEIIEDDMPDPAELAADPDGRNDHPVMPWIAQSMAGQSPPVLYWPAPGVGNAKLTKRGSKPCGADQAIPVAEPKIIHLIGMALMAAILAGGV